MTKRITIIDLAKAAGVGVSTVDRILNRRGPVQRSTAEHVVTVAQEIGYQGLPNLRRRLSEDAPERTFGFLLNRRERFLYGSFAKSLANATISSARIKGKAVVRHLDDLSPAATVDALLELGEECDSIAGVCIEHPRVNEAIRDLAQRGKSFWAMLSDVSAEERAGYVATNAWNLGRTAGWFMTHLAPAGSTIAVFTGSENYLCQRDYVAGFHSYLTSDFDIIATEETGESDQHAYDFTLRVLDRTPNAAAIFMAGGGIDGVVAARMQRPESRIRLISTEISETTPLHLRDNLVDVALSHEFDRVAETVVGAMAKATSIKTTSRPLIYNVPMRIAIKENV